MEHATSIFELRTSVEDDRPEMDFQREDHRAINWLLVDKVLRGLRPATDYPGVRLIVVDAEALNWDFYAASGTHGLISGRAIERIGIAAFRLFELLPASINEAPYFFLRSKDTLPCFDRENSVVVPFPSNPNRIMDVKKYKFKLKMIPAPPFFCVPELFWPFATESVKLVAERGRLKGMNFMQVE